MTSLSFFKVTDYVCRLLWNVCLRLAFYEGLTEFKWKWNLWYRKKKNLIAQKLFWGLTKEIYISYPPFRIPLLRVKLYKNHYSPTGLETLEWSNILVSHVRQAHAMCVHRNREEYEQGAPES